MTTVSVLIGNSDNKLTQLRWSEFVSQLDAIIYLYCRKVHFIGCTDSSSRYQTHCIVFEIAPRNLDDLKQDLLDLRDEFKQDSIAVVVGKTELI